MIRKCFLFADCLALVVLLTACAAPSSPTVTSVPPQPTKAAATAAAASTPAPPGATPKPVGQPKYGGIVTRALSRDATSFDLQRESGADISATIFNVYEGLVRIHSTEHERILPELVEKWEVNQEGTAYAFTFPKGIKWHDGQPFTMDDVKYSLERMQNPEAFKTISPRGKGLLAAMDTATIVNENTLRINLKYPSASFLLNIATGWIAIEPKHILVAKGDMRRDLVGTGPFKFKGFEPNISLELEKNKDYHVKGLPYLDGLKFFTIKDAATRFAAFRSGTVKVTFTGTGGLTPAETEIVNREMAGKAVAYEHDSQTPFTVSFNMQRKPWDDVRVRKAVDLVFDRQAALKINGRGFLNFMYVQPWGMKPDEVDKLSGYRQPKETDVAEAKRLLADAGFPNGFKTTMLVQVGGARERQGIFAKDQLAKIGIDTELALVEPAAFFERRDVRRAFDLISVLITNNTSDPSEPLYANYATGASANYSRFSDKQIDDLIDKQARTMDTKAREAILGEIEKRAFEQVPMVILFWDLWQTGAWTEVKGFRPGPGLHPWGKFDRVWLDR